MTEPHTFVSKQWFDTDYCLEGNIGYRHKAGNFILAPIGVTSM